MVELLHLVPIIIFVAFPATFIITYIWAVLNKHVYPLLPQVSDTGTLPPESCLFSMMLNLTAALILFSIYIRHKEVIEVFRAKKLSESIPFSMMVNRITTIVGLVACVGLDLVANFQETNVLTVHGIGALICFWSSAIYILLQTVITFWIIPEMNGFLMVFIRGLLGICAILFIISRMVTGSLALKEFNAAHINTTRILQWTPDLPGWKWHVASSGSEWILVLTLGFFILTYYWDFRKISLEAPELVMYAEPQPQPVQARSFKDLSLISI